jgi:hypothetical protein
MLSLKLLSIIGSSTLNTCSALLLEFWLVDGYVLRNFSKKLVHTSSEKQKEKIKVLRENNSSMTKILGNKENDVTNFLSSSKSFSQYNKERMDTFCVPKSIAETNVQKRIEELEFWLVDGYVLRNFSKKLVHTSYISVVPSEADLAWRIALEIID